MSLTNIRNGFKIIQRCGRIYLMQQKRNFPSFSCKEIIGDREIVGHGLNGECYYLDHPAFPFPAVRFQKPTPDIMFLQEKEKGDWRNLSIKEKKILYRASFCQTFEEINANDTGRWQSHVGIALILMSAGVWWFIILKKICNVELPKSFTKNAKDAQLKRQIILEVNPIHGLASKWNYEENKWK